MKKIGDIIIFGPLVGIALQCFSHCRILLMMLCNAFSTVSAKQQGNLGNYSDFISIFHAYCIMLLKFKLLFIFYF